MDETDRQPIESIDDRTLIAWLLRPDDSLRKWIRWIGSCGQRPGVLAYAAMAVRRFESLDGMRGICALLVALLHFGATVPGGSVVSHGWLSVDVFFVLSGFVISLNYEDKLSTTGSFARFLLARARRLLPTQIIGTAIVGASVATLYLTGHMLNTPVTMSGIGIALLYGLALVPIVFSPAASEFAYFHQAFPINPPLWSLQGEWIVNVVYAWLLARTRTGILVLIFACLAIYLVVSMSANGRGWDRTVPFEFFPSVARAMAGFVAGMVLYRLEIKGTLQLLPSTHPGLIFAIWFLICTMPSMTPTPIVEAMVALFISPLAVSLLIRTEKPVSKIFTFLGLLSYPLYASHSAIAFISLMWLNGGRPHSKLLVLAMLAAALALAWLVSLIASRIGMKRWRCAPQPELT